VLIETEKYPDWNPVMTKVDGRHEVGKTLNFNVVVPGEKPLNIKAKVVKVDSQKLLQQKGGIWGVLTFNHQYKFEKVGTSTKVIQKEDYSGVGLLFWDHKKMIKTFGKSNEALKKGVESLK
tara:strand:+ start:509 stop:871 length:363 start_codon:yes stop_codon:yes gene_type:complete